MHFETVVVSDAELDVDFALAEVDEGRTILILRASSIVERGGAILGQVIEAFAESYCTKRERSGHHAA